MRYGWESSTNQDGECRFPADEEQETHAQAHHHGEHSETQVDAGIPGWLIGPQADATVTTELAAKARLERK